MSESVSMSDLPIRESQPVTNNTKAAPVRMSDIQDAGGQEQKKAMIANNRKISDVLRQGQWKGQRCFIIGGGPSVKNFDLKKLEGENTIAINLAFRLFNPTIIYGMDARLWGWIELGDTGPLDKLVFDKCKAIKVWSDTEMVPLPEEIFIAKSIGRPGLSHDIKEGVACGTNSGYGALNIALLLGASEIYLIGYDFNGEGWHKDYPAPRGVGHDFHMECYNESSEEYKTFPSKIINLNRESGLKIFEFGDMPTDVGQKVVKSTEPQRTKSNDDPIFVSYFTTEPAGYKIHADRLRESLTKFNLEFDVQPVKSRGGWDVNTKLKAEFLLTMLLRHPGKDVVWIDADAIVAQLPEKVMRCKADVAVHYRDDEGVLSGLIYLKNNDRARDLLKAWKGLCDLPGNKEVWDQKLLQEAIENLGEKITVEKLPPEYCYIIGLVNPDVEPVIEQYQASRVLKQ